MTSFSLIAFGLFVLLNMYLHMCISVWTHTQMPSPHCPSVLIYFLFLVWYIVSILASIFPCSFLSHYDLCFLLLLYFLSFLFFSFEVYSYVQYPPVIFIFKSNTLENSVCLAWDLEKEENALGLTAAGLPGEPQGIWTEILWRRSSNYQYLCFSLVSVKDTMFAKWKL